MRMPSPPLSLWPGCQPGSTAGGVWWNGRGCIPFLADRSLIPTKIGEANLMESMGNWTWPFTMDFVAEISDWSQVKWVCVSPTTLLVLVATKLEILMRMFWLLLLKLDFSAYVLEDLWYTLWLKKACRELMGANKLGWQWAWSGIEIPEPGAGSVRPPMYVPCILRTISEGKYMSY
jgi:hypothetical protein